MDDEHRRYHEIANLFPLMQGDEFESLKADVRAHGLLEPIMLYTDGSVLDGRNRLRACIETGVAPRFEHWQGGDSITELTAYVVSKNMRRRHLDSGQRAAIAVQAEDLVRRLEEEARERMLAGVAPSPVQMFAQGEQGKTREHLAGLFDTNHQYIQDAKRLKAEAPERLEQVAAGETTLSRAIRDHRRETQRSRAATTIMPQGVYRVLYADPPWDYAQVIDKYGPAERHYATMTLDELCMFGELVKGICDDNAVLFLWSTSPKLRDAFTVMDAWGFRYSGAMFIWDKVRHNFGHYNSVRHELLLICIKGSCPPDTSQLVDSVQTIERSSEHSEKPEEFRQIIDLLYPHGNRIELFARQSVAGWDAWGAEA